MTQNRDPRTGSPLRSMRLHRVMRAIACAALVVLGGCGGPATRRETFDPDAVPEAYRQSTAALMWPGASRAFQILPKGDLYNGAWLVRIRPFSDGHLARPPRTVAYEARWCPVAHWRRTSGEVRWDFEACALPEPAPRDSGLLVSLEVQATNTGAAAHEARLELALKIAPEGMAFAVFDAPEFPAPPLRWGGGGSRDTVYGWAAHAGGDSTLVARWRLAPRESRRLSALLPAYPVTARALRKWAGPSHRERAARVRAYWSRQTSRGLRLELGDPEVEDAVRAARVVLLSCRERHGPRWLPIGGPFQYRDVWLRDGARLVQALAVSGYTPEARELAAGLRSLQWPHGPFLSQRGQLDGTGQALWAFEQALLRPARDDSVAGYAEAALRAWDWCERQRAVGRASGWTFGRMLPFSDPRDAEDVRAQLVGTDAWALAGYRAAARLLRACGRATEADSVEASRARYQDDFLQALAWAPGADVPPSWQGAGRDWGNLSVVYPCGVLPASSPRFAALARRVWAAAGGAGLGTYGGVDSLHSYLAADVATWALLAGRRAQADSMLDAMLAWRNASGAAAEMFSRTTRDFARNLPPHPTAAAALVALTRNLLVFDDDDTLRLTLGARAPWWRNGRVRAAPTRWGQVDLSFRRRGRDAEWTWTPVPVWTALTLPPGTLLAEAAAAPLVGAAADPVVLAPPGTRRARVTLSPPGSAAP